MKARELKEEFVNFFVSKDHIEIPSSNLIPENDSSTLFVSAGMHPLVPYLLGQKHPLGNRLVDIQKCVRTGDIEEVGDKFHHTFFEMLGNWSLGDYFKKEMIPWSFEFLTKHLNYKLEQIHVTCFEGDKNAPKDTESYDLWLKQGIIKSHIHYLPKKDNWWGPIGEIGPCGPDTEIFIDLRPEDKPIDFKIACKQERIVEIGNDVFMEYNKNSKNEFKSLSQKNVDTGYGVERNIAVLNGATDNYLTDIWKPIIKVIEELCDMIYGDKSDESYIKEGNQCWVDVRKSMRIIADHIRSAVFIIADGVEPSNKETGYVLRRLIRRSIRQGKLIGIEDNFLTKIAQAVLDNQNNLAGVYPELDENKERILSILETEENKFRKTLNRGLNEINKLIKKNKSVSGRQAFTLYESFGFPVEMIQEELKKSNLKLDIKTFEEAKKEHQQKSKTLSAGKFKSGLADDSEIITKYHTTTHLLHTALRNILGDHVQQSGSNITSERLRFDFTNPEKVTEKQIKEIEDQVNQKIKSELQVTKEDIPFKEAQKQNALAFFGNKYPEIVSVFTIGSKNDFYSKEVCTGPHVESTGKLGKFEVTKEESAGSGKRRIYAVLK